jgi:hypothetical protein
MNAFIKFRNLTLKKKKENFKFPNFRYFLNETTFKAITKHYCFVFQIVRFEQSFIKEIEGIAFLFLFIFNVSE